MSQLLEFLQTHEEAFRSRYRLASLYSDFTSQRTTNPEGYTANSSAWLRAIKSAVNAGLLPSQAGDKYILHTGDQLSNALQTQEHGRPLALGIVVEDAVNKKELLPLKDFLQAKASINSKSWVPTPWQAIQWGLRQLGVSGGHENGVRMTEGRLVILSNVEAASKAILAAAPTIATSRTSRIFSRELFSSTFSQTLGQDITPTDLSVLLTYLSRDISAISYSSSSDVIKFPSPSEARPVSAITPDDISIASLRTLISSLETQVSALASRISELDLSAREAVAQKRLPAAKVALRHKKTAGATLSRREAALAQLEGVYAGIEQAADQVEMVAVMQDAGKVLKSLNTRTGGVEAVQDLADKLRDEIMTTEEIGDAINGVSAGEIDEGEVEDELEKLEREASGKEEGEVQEEKKGEEEKGKTAEEQLEETNKKLAELKLLETPEGEIGGGLNSEEKKEAETSAA